MDRPVSAIPQGPPAVVRAGREHAVTLLAELDGPVEGVLADDGRPIEVDAALRAGGEAHLQRALAAAPGTWNGPILGFRSFDGATITAGRTDYFTMLATSDALSAERAAGMPEGPLRTRAVELAGGDPTRSGAGRASVVGVSTLVSLVHGDREWLVLGRRTADLAVSPGLVGTIDGCTEAGADDRPLAANVIREIEEEAPGVVALLGDDPPAAVRRDARLLGVSMNMLRLSPTISVHLRVAAPAPPAPQGLLAPGEFAEAVLVEATPAGLEALWRGEPLLAPPAAGTLALWEARAGVAYL
jgi:hypothetical protein